MKHRSNGTPPDLEDVVRLLGESRPALDEHQAERMVTRITHRSTSHRISQETPLRSRLAVITMLVLGFAFSGSGVGLAISGSGSSGTSATQQYDKPDDSDVLGDQGGNDGVDNGVKNDGASGGNPSDTSTDSTQPSRQTTVEAGDTGSSLPFTGFAAVPVMLIGLALLASGLVLRRRTAQDR